MQRINYLEMNKSTDNKME